MDNKKSARVTASIIKADAPVQIETDKKLFGSDWLDPPIPMDSLGVMVDNSGILPQCISAYKKNIAGYGIGIKYIDDDQEETSETMAEWSRLEDIINLLTIEKDTKELFEDIVECRERHGTAYAEVIRDRAGDVVQLDFIKEVQTVQKSVTMDYANYEYHYKGKTIQRSKMFRKFKQTIGGTTVYFKEFGDPRKMDFSSGEYIENIDVANQANEIIEFPLGTDNYGKVRWIGQILGVDGARRAEHLNNNYFINGRHTPLMICIKGGTLTEGSRSLLEQYMNGVKGAAGQHAFLVLETESIDTDFDAKQPEIELKDLASILQKDELFQEYEENTRKRVQSAFNLPDLYVGYTQDFNRATAQTAMEVTEKQVFQPERASLAWILNNKLLNGYDLKYCEVEFKAPEITNPDDLYKLLTVAEKAGGLPPNKAKQVAYTALGESSDDYDGDWGDIPLVVQAQLNAAEQREMQQEQLKTMNQSQEPTAEEGTQDFKQGTKKPNTIETQLDNQIQKAEQNNEPQEMVSVMKEVRRLLTDIRKQGDADGED